MFKSFKEILKKTTTTIKKIIYTSDNILDKDKLEIILLDININYDLVEYILENLPNNFERKDLNKIFMSIFDIPKKHKKNISTPFIDIIIGVNGAGKTTTVAKLAKLYQNNEKTVMIGAADTFRAAAIEQLNIWAEKLKVPIISIKRGGDPSAVVHNTIYSANAKNIDNVIIDTAGRLHTNKNLSGELKKIIRTATKLIKEEPHRKILIIDGTQGTSAINQAKLFNDMVGIDGIIITKLDGTAKGGSLFSIVKELEIPILFIGVGEEVDDLVEFNHKDYISNILDEIFPNSINEYA